MANSRMPKQEPLLQHRVHAVLASTTGVQSDLPQRLNITLSPPIIALESCHYRQGKPRYQINLPITALDIHVHINTPYAQS